MIDATVLRDAIATALGDSIGIYTFSGGQMTPAIRIEDGSDPYDEEPSVEGLEVVIQPEETIGVTSFLAGDKQVALSSKIVLKQWDIEQTTKAAREILIKQLDDIEDVGPLVPRNGRLNNIEIFTITISTAFYLLKPAHG
jgi:hypothetical protein